MSRDDKMKKRKINEKRMVARRIGEVDRTEDKKTRIVGKGE